MDDNAKLHRGRRVNYQIKMASQLPGYESHKKLVGFCFRSIYNRKVPPRTAGELALATVEHEPNTSTGH